MLQGCVKRVTVFRNGQKSGGKVIKVPDTFEDLLEICGSCLGIRAACVFTSSGGMLEDIELIRDNEVLYVSSGKDYTDPNLTNHLQPCLVVDPDCCTFNPNGDWITLNVGGKIFHTTRATLVTKEPDSMLARMFSTTPTAEPWSSAMDMTGAYLVDRSPDYFEPLLNYLRHGRLVLNDGVNAQGVLEEAKFFGITSVLEQLEETVKANEKSDDAPITRQEFVRILLSTPSSCELRCQGINLECADLSKLDLRHINFKLANLRRTDLAGANLSYCHLERADLSGAHMDNAILSGAGMQRANLEGASLRGCNFEDQTGQRATNLEGVNMKNCDLEGSHMSGVNLRVATLKGSNLQNCNLRAAILAGADLENCNLSGCDLQEANLRGANIVGATFEEMLAPLHMSQSVGAHTVRQRPLLPDDST